MIKYISFICGLLTLECALWAVPRTLEAQSYVSNVPNNLKIGGVSFRVDDDHPISEWYSYAKVFDKYGYHFTFAQNLELEQGVEDYFQMIRNLQASGHEMADHTPNHNTLFFGVDDTTAYSGAPGVDHINGNTVCLTYDHNIDTSLYNGQAAPGGCVISIIGGMAYSIDPGAFRDFVKMNGTLWGIYIPGTHQLYSIGDLSNVYASDSTNIDTLKLLSYWWETVPIKDTMGVWCHFVGEYNVKVTTAALELLADRTLQLCDAHSLARPATWIQPGGMWPFAQPTQIEQIYGNERGYTSAETFPTASLKCYDQSGSSQDTRFRINWGDFYEDQWELKTVESVIADNVARHYFLMGHSHFNELLGGWNGYVSRMDSLLAWCRQNSSRIQVQTVGEMTHLLYDVPQDPYVNIMPPLNVDLDNNQVPDGYWMSPTSVLDSTDGLLSDGGYSLSVSTKATFCTITDLAGVEKGQNDFSIWTKGATGDTITVTFSMTGYPNQVYTFPATSAGWTNYTLYRSANHDTSLVIPSDVSTLNIAVICTSYKSGTVKVSGMLLRKKMTLPISILGLPDTMATVGRNFSTQLVTACMYPADPISYQLLTAPAWLQISANGTLSGVAPVVPGVFAVSIVAADQHGDTASITSAIHVEGVHPSAIQIVSAPDSVVAPNATYYSPVYSIGVDVNDTLTYTLLTGPRWLSMMADGILSGIAPITDSTTHLVTIVVRDQFADADTQSYWISVHPIVVDSLNYSDSPLNHGWVASLASGTISVGFDSTIHAKKLSVSSQSGLDFGIDKYGRWLANTVTASVKGSSPYLLRVWLVDNNSTSTYISYYPGSGASMINPDNTISIYIGNAASSGSWTSFARNLDLDLTSVKWGSTVRRILGFSIRGSVQVADLNFGQDVNDSAVPPALKVASTFQLVQNYPNPFNPATTISYYLPLQSSVLIRIYNVLGERVKTILERSNVAHGDHSVVWRGDTDFGTMVSSGVYFCQMEATPTNGAPKFVAVKKMLLLK
ncbi:MAG TPA: putative Ig domain-containing protein [Candidatus Kryptonia bacterium]